MSSASTASMQFTPEWLKPGRKQPTKQPSFSSLGMCHRPQSCLLYILYALCFRADEDTARRGGVTDHIHAPSYSSLVSGATAMNGSSAMDSGTVTSLANGAHPFRYSKEQMLGVWREGGGGAQNSVLGAEVARWPNIVRDSPTEPVGLRELSMDEKKVRHHLLLTLTRVRRGHLSTRLLTCTLFWIE